MSSVCGVVCGAPVSIPHSHNINMEPMLYERIFSKKYNKIAKKFA